MDFAQYQKQTRQTDQRPGTELQDVAVHLLGLAGEAGSVASEYKKKLRDSDAHAWWKHRMREELGDVLWYVATLANKLELDLDDIATANLHKTRNRWLATRLEILDAEYPEHERLPRNGAYRFVSTTTDEGRPAVQVFHDGRQVGSRLTDAAHVDDGYRFHDVFHLAHATLIGWSPVTRLLLGRKRRSNPTVDENEDGGRAIVTEEAISILVWAYALHHNHLDGVTRLDQALLDTVQSLAGPTEAGDRSASDWEAAILAGYRVFRDLIANDGGTVVFDAAARTLTYASGS